MAIPDWLASDDAVRHVQHRSASPGVTAEWPLWLPDPCREAIEAAGISRPWSHQRELADLLFAGRHAAICTPTASGKSLGYLLPIMAATAGAAGTVGVPVDGLRARLGVQQHTALYLAPTKALAHDQWRGARALGPKGWAVATLDGDSEQGERRFARDHATFVLTNPDMVHRSVLPNHARWTRLLSGLRYVVVDESHRYRGVFGAHVSAVLRRLRRLCALYGANPTFVLASATASNAGVAGARLIGEDTRLAVVDADGAPHAARDVVLYQPHDSTPHDAADLMATLVDEGKQVITFVASRTQAELIAIRAQDRVTSGRRILGYRSGYLADDRRTIETSLQSGALGGVAATNALELGVDIAGMDAVVIAGFPGTLAALWQQAGRAGRGSRDALVIMLAREDPLDAYLFDHPELIFDAPIEATVLDSANPYVLGPHLAAAAQESHLRREDERWFGPSMVGLADQLCAAGLLRRRATGWFWCRAERAVDSIDLRSLAGRPLDIVDSVFGRVVGQVDLAAADRTVHEGAVYLHQGDQWLVDEYVPDDHLALVHLDRPGYFTQPKSISTVRILTEKAGREFGRGRVCTGTVELSNQVTGYLRRDEVSGDVWDETGLELPEHTMMTQALWWTIPDEVVAELGFNPVRLAAAAHAAEHTAIGLLPMLVTCDRWDIGGLSTVLHQDTGCCTIVVHDGHPGGAGIAEQGFERAEQWLRATLERLTNCPCQNGCPACVVSPKCGNANQMLDKSAARLLVAALLGEAAG